VADADGVPVDAQLRTRDPAIWAAGDIARYPDALTGERIRIEHWVVAQRQGQAAARSMLGSDAPFAAVPFFWTQQHGTSVNYTGHAQRWDEVQSEGDVAHGDGRVTLLRGGSVLAVVTVGRDRDSLEAEIALEAAVARRAASARAETDHAG
jgi:3-phenylpropionate/trans-cinnamate dioxygenase ferredoxin reductase subunit